MNRALLGRPIKLSDVAGIWEGKSMVGPKDSLFATWVLTATADGKSWTEMGPYLSVLRRGQRVTTLHVRHYGDDKMTGTLKEHFQSGDVVLGTIAATRKR